MTAPEKVMAEKLREIVADATFWDVSPVGPDDFVIRTGDGQEFRVEVVEQ